MHDVLPVIRLLRSFDLERLEALLMRRRVPARASCGIVDVAEWLVEPTTVREAVARLSWRAARRMQLGDAAALDEAQTLALAVPSDAGPTLLPAVSAELTSLLERATPIATAPASLAPSDAGRDARGAERAGASAALVADLIVDFDANGRAARDGRAGPRLANVDVRRIAASADLEPERVDAISAAMHRAGLAGAADEAWSPTARGRAFERGPRIDRWRAITDAWLDGLAVDVREAVLSATQPPSPLTEADADPASEAVEGAVQLGLLVDGTLTTAGRLVLDDRVDEAAAALAPLLPAEVEGVYVQPDLSIIAPGPLSPEHEARLRTVADLEQRGTASSYRLSTGSAARAFAAGATEAEVLDLLTELSLVPLPQPVRYLVAEAAARHGLVRVRPSGSGSRILSEDPEVLDGLAVDQSLGALRLRRRPDGSLDTLLAPTHALAALIEARLPAVLEDESGATVAPPAPRTASQPEQRVTAAARRLAASLREEAQRQGDGDPSSAWLSQRLERARRAKVSVRMRVRINEGEAAELTAVPVSMTSRWLRVIDPEADVERTFPLAAVELLDDDANAPATDEA